MPCDDQQTDFGAAFLAGREESPAQVIEIAGVPHLVTRTDQGGHRVTDHQALLSTPVHKRATVLLHQPASFIAYVQAFRDAHTVLFADARAASITAVLDYHEHAEGRPRWGHHVAMFKARTTPEWDRWTRASGRKMTQVEMAEFLEDNLPDIAAPTGAHVYEVAQSLEATKTAQFSSGIRLRDGQTQLAYEETIQARAGEKGRLEIPESFTLGLEPFEGTSHFEVVARFRYRVADGGALTLWFDLLRPEKVLEAAFAEMLESTRLALPETLIVQGTRGKGTE